jgi:hypothetical protein
MSWDITLRLRAPARRKRTFTAWANCSTKSALAAIVRNSRRSCPDIAKRSDRDALVELDAVVTRAWQFDPRQKYADADGMLVELELMQRGESVQGKRRLQKFWVGFRRVGVALTGLAAVVVMIFLLLPRNVASNVDPEGPPSTNLGANVTCQQGIDINANARNKRSEWEIGQWSYFQEQRVPTDNEGREFFSGFSNPCQGGSARGYPGLVRRPGRRRLRDFWRETLNSRL